MKPLARKHNIHIEKLPGEIAVYDKENHSVHCLNSTVATVWENADGTKSIDELAHLVEEKFGVTQGRDIVLVALDQLAEANLLDHAAERTEETLPSRRSIGRKLVLTGFSAAAMPAMASIFAPPPRASRSQIDRKNPKDPLIPRLLDDLL